MQYEYKYVPASLILSSNSNIGVTSLLLPRALIIGLISSTSYDFIFVFSNARASKAAGNAFSFSGVERFVFFLSFISYIAAHVSPGRKRSFSVVFCSITISMTFLPASASSKDDPKQELANSTPD